MSITRVAALAGLFCCASALWTGPAHACLISDGDALNPDAALLAPACPIDMCAACRAVVDDGTTIAPYLSRHDSGDAAWGIALFYDQKVTAYVHRNASGKRGAKSRPLHVFWEAGESCEVQVSPRRRWQTLPQRCAPQPNRFPSSRIEHHRYVMVEPRQVGIVLEDISGMETGGHPRWAPNADQVLMMPHERRLEEEMKLLGKPPLGGLRSLRRALDHQSFNGFSSFDVVLAFEGFNPNPLGFKGSPILAVAPLPRAIPAASAAATRQKDMSWHWRTREGRYLVAMFFSRSAQRLYGVTAPIATRGRYELVVLATQDEAGSSHREAEPILTTSSLTIPYLSHVAE